jgi:hypothetical protein
VSMKAQEVIPVKKEFTFLFKIAAVMVISAVASMVIIYFFLNKDIGASYRAAFQMLSQTLQKMNIYIAVAVLVQLIFSSIVVYFVSLYFSHKIAGPVFRLKAVLQQYLDGEDIEKVSFRQTDFIPGVSRLFTDFLGFMGKRKSLLQEAETLVVKLEQARKPERSQLLEKLENIIKQLEDRS